MNAKLAGICLALALSPIVFLLGAYGPVESAKIAGSSVRIELPTGLGSGVYIGNGMVITAAHVVGDMPIAQVISDDGVVQTGTVLWVNRAYDIAAVQIEDGKNAASPLACRAPIVGEALDAEGNPVGIKFITMHGYVAGAARELAPKWKSAFVADLTVISGMSGGGVYDQFGEVIGITVGAMDPHGAPDAPAAGGLGFIVPSSVVCQLLGRA